MGNTVKQSVEPLITKLTAIADEANYKLHIEHNIIVKKHWLDLYMVNKDGSYSFLFDVCESDLKLAYCKLINKFESLTNYVKTNGTKKA